MIFTNIKELFDRFSACDITSRSELKRDVESRCEKLELMDSLLFKACFDRFLSMWIEHRFDEDLKGLLLSKVIPAFIKTGQDTIKSYFEIYPITETQLLCLYTNLIESGAEDIELYTKVFTSESEDQINTPAQLWIDICSAMYRTSQCGKLNINPLISYT